VVLSFGFQVSGFWFVFPSVTLKSPTLGGFVQSLWFMMDTIDTMVAIVLLVSGFRFQVSGF